MKLNRFQRHVMKQSDLIPVASGAYESRDGKTRTEFYGTAEYSPSLKAGWYVWKRGRMNPTPYRTMRAVVEALAGKRV